MGRYNIAARKAAAAVEQQIEHMPCVNPANNLIHAFLLEVRRMKLAEGPPTESVLENTFAVSLKKAADGIQHHPYRVYDAKSAQEVKGIGPAIAKCIQEELFKEFPADPPTHTELQQIRQAQTALTERAEAAKRKRKANEAALNPLAANSIGGLAPSIGPSALAGGTANLVNTSATVRRYSDPSMLAVPFGMQSRTAAVGRSRSGTMSQRRADDIMGYESPQDDDDDDDALANDILDMISGRRGRGGSRGRGRGRTASRPSQEPKQPRAAKEYIPNLRTANYAFLIVLFQAQKGPQKKEYLLKAELMDLAEASGLSQHPIHPQNGGAAAVRTQHRGAFNTGVTARQQYDGWSNFKRLVSANLAYSFSSPLKISLTLRGFALAERLYRDAVRSGIASPVLGLPADGPLQYQLESDDGVGTTTTAAAAQHPQQQLNGGIGIGNALPSAALRPAIGGAARRGQGANGVVNENRRRSSSNPSSQQILPPSQEALELPLVERLARQQQQQGAAQPPPISARPQRRAHRHGSGFWATAAQSLDSGDDNDDDGMYNTNEEKEEEEDIIDLAVSSDDEQQQQQRQRPSRQHQQQDETRRSSGSDAALAPASLPPSAARSTPPAARVVPDEQIAVLMEMGYTDKRARKALRKSLGIEDALDTIDLISSSSSSDCSDNEVENNEEQQQQQQVRGIERTAARPPFGNSGLGTANNNNTAKNEAEARRSAALAAILRVGSTTLNPSTANGTAGGAIGHIRAGASQPDARIRIGSQSQSQQQQQFNAAALGLLDNTNDTIINGQQQAEPSKSHSDMPAPSDSWQQRQRGFATSHRQQQQQQQQQQQLERADAESRPRTYFNPNHLRTGTTRNTANPVTIGDGTDDGVDRSNSKDAVSGFVVEPSGQAEIVLPPLAPNQKFEDHYQVVLLVDGREQYSRVTGTGTNAANHSSRTTALEAHIQRMRSSGLAIDQRTLPVGDVIWVARSKTNPTQEYVLDYILERKSLHDLLQSIKTSNRYNSQKYFLKKCGLRYLYYLIEGDPDLMATPQDQKVVKSAAVNTEIHDGFRILRTTGHVDTFRTYQNMTEAIISLYSSQKPSTTTSPTRSLMTFEAWKEHMRSVDKGGTTLHDIWGCMLSEVPGLGPEAVSVVLMHYPTPVSLWKAYRNAIIQAQNAGRSGRFAGEQMLAGLKNSRTGRSLGTEKSRKVFRELYASGWDVIVT